MPSQTFSGTANVVNIGNTDEKSFTKLKASIDWSERQLDFVRAERIQYIRQYVGTHYSRQGSDRKMPVNFLKLAVDVYVRQLAAQSPRVLITTRVRDLKPTALNLELSLNQVPKEIGLDQTFRRLVMEALFSIGVAKVGLHTVGSLLDHEYGQPFVDVVTFDDFFLDMSARTIEAVHYMGNSYWLDIDDVKNSGYYPKKRTSDLEPDKYQLADEHGRKRANAVSTDEQADVYKDRIWLKDVWIPGERKIVTYAVTAGRVINTIDWDGPDNGPYHVLGFSDVPGNLLPLSPVSSWVDMNDLANALFRKLGKGADNQKNVLGFSGSDTEAAGNFKNASDGDGITYTGQPPSVLKAGGIDQTTLAFFLQVQQFFSYFAGNLDSLGGLGAQTETVGQDKLLNEAAGARLRDMSARTVETIRDIFTSIAHYEWDDPIKRRKLDTPIPGTDMTVPSEFGPEDKMTKFDLFDLDIDVFSLTEKSPTVELQKLGLIMQQYIIPLMPAIQQAGGTLDVQAIIKLVSKYSNLPELDDIVTWQPAAPDAMANGGPGSGAEKKVTEHIRRNVAQPTKQGGEKVLMNALLGQKSQDSEVANLT